MERQIAVVFVMATMPVLIVPEFQTEEVRSTAAGFAAVTATPAPISVRSMT
jgi:hypothetical protein